MPADARCIDHTAEVAERWEIWRTEKRSRRRDDRGRGVSSAAVFATLTDLVDDDAVLCVDVGNNTYSFGRYFEMSGRQDVLMSGHLGSIRFGLPAALGAWAAVGDTRKVVSVSGDGGGSACNGPTSWTTRGRRRCGTTGRRWSRSSRNPLLV